MLYTQHVSSLKFGSIMLMNSPFLVPSRRRPSRLVSLVSVQSSSPSSCMDVNVNVDVKPQQIAAPKKRVVVCGGGVIGVCTAYFLSKKGAAVTLIEQSSIAVAASGKAGGFLALDWCDAGPVAALARASFDLHRSLAGELNGGHTYGYRSLTTLSLSVTESENPTPTGRGLSLPSWIDGPARSGKTIGTPATTAQVHPQLFTRRLLETAVAEYGVEVVIGKLERVETAAATVTAVLEGGGVVGGDAVVLALGPWTSKLTWLSSVVRVNGLKAHSIVLEPKEMDVITAHALFLSYYPAHGGQPMDPEIYPRPTGEVYVCGMSSEEEVPDDPEQIEPNPDSIRVLKRVAKTVSSHLGEEAQVKVEQACFLPCTDDNVPVIGEIPGMKGCYVATGHSCWGILNGPASGAAMAELVMDGCATIVDLTPFSPARFSRGRARRR